MMNFRKRLQKLWELSASATDEKIQTEEPALRFHEDDELEGVKLKEVFIPRITRDPVKELINETQND